MGRHGRSTIASPETAFFSITMVRALAIAGIIVENYHNTLSWNDTGGPADAFTMLSATAAGTLVHMFFVISGFGLTLTCLRKGCPSWAVWAGERFRKVVLPYWAAISVTYIVANLSPLWAPPGWQASFSWLTLLSYLAFLRNSYEPAWNLNPAFWFMPVILGLYVLLPLLLRGLKWAGSAVFLLLAILVSYGSIAVAVHGGFSIGHQAASPLYFLDEFALGMALAGIAHGQPDEFLRLTGLPSFGLGLALYATGAVITQYKLMGAGSGAYNDIFSASGLYLMLIVICRRVYRTGPPAALGFIEGVSNRSYVMYLVHWPILAWVMKPLAGHWFETEMGAIPMLLSSLVFVLTMYLLAEGLFRMVPGLAGSRSMR